MSKLSQRLVRQLARHREEAGTQVLFNGAAYTVTYEEVAAAVTGAQTVSVETFGPFVASTDSHEFQFSPHHFKPWTLVQAPQEGDILLWHDLRYLVTSVSYIDISDDTIALLVKSFRHISG